MKPIKLVGVVVTPRSLDPEMLGTNPTHGDYDGPLYSATHLSPVVLMGLAIETITLHINALRYSVKMAINITAA